MKKQEKSQSIYLGTFNSEHFWRDPETCRLPSIHDYQSDAIVAVMDEIQFVLCNHPQDILITRFPMDTIHKNYLCDLGFNFLNNEMPVQDKAFNEPQDTPKSICQRLIEMSKKKYFKTLIAPKSKLSPYSVLPFIKDLCTHYNFENKIPNIETVKKVNSKIFSHNLARQIFGDTVGEIVYSVEDLEIKGKSLLQDSPFLIKEEFGVSGKGNILINSRSLLERIVKYLLKQEELGKKTRFVLEPFLNKHIDFSCQLKIEETGRIAVLTIQQMQNNDFNFYGIQRLDKHLMERIEKTGYYKQVKKIAEGLYREGYYGHVCIDSMILGDERIMPLIEINARKSMGLINYYIDRYLSQFSICGNMIFFSLGIKRDIEFKEIIHKMELENILFLKHKPNGIIPLSSNTLSVNKRLSEKVNSYKPYKGRLYASIVSENIEEKELILNKMNKIFTDLGIIVFN